MEKKLDVRGIGQQVFSKILVARLVAMEHRSFSQVKFKSAQVFRVVVAPGHERNLDRIDLSGGYHMDFQSVEISALAAVKSPVDVVSGCFCVDSAPINSDVITDLDWAAIDEENVRGTGHSVQSAEPLEEGFQDRIQRVEPPVGLVSAEQNPKVRWAFEQVQSGLEVPAEEASDHDRGGHHLSVGDSALEAFLMVTSL